MEKRIWRPRDLISRPELIKRRKERALSGAETHASLKDLSGRHLLESAPVQDLLAYTADWEPFIVNKNPHVLPDSQLPPEAPKVVEFSPAGEIALPYPFIIPSRKEGKDSQWGQQQFYWDMYFINKALLASGKPQYLELAKNHIENFEFLFNRLNIIPNASQKAILNRTQIPFLTGMITDIYRVTQDKVWLAEKIQLAEREYEKVWMATKEEAQVTGGSIPSHRIDNQSLIVRAAGTDILTEHYPAAAMTGEDDSAQWAKRAYEYAPVSLNCALYKYESDLAYAHSELGHDDEAQRWQKVADRRKKEINDTFWDEKRGMYFDMKYNRQTGKWEKDLDYKALSTFMPLWVNLTSPEQAEKVTQHLPLFESPYGLFIAAKDTVPSERWARLRNTLVHKPFRRSGRFLDAANDVFKPEQWNYPNIWAPFEYFVIDGMLNYDKKPQAQQVIERVLRGLAAFYQSKGTLPEKLNGETGENGGNYQYGDQEGFGWTSALAQIAAGRLESIVNDQPSSYATIAA